MNGNNHNYYCNKIHFIVSIISFFYLRTTYSHNLEVKEQMLKLINIYRRIKLSKKDLFLNINIIQVYTLKKQ